ITQSDRTQCSRDQSAARGISPSEFQMFSDATDCLRWRATMAKQILCVLNALPENMKTASFVPFWSKGKDSFKSDPPNADISLPEGDKLPQVVAELQDPLLTGDELRYTVKILQGQLPAKAADVSVFIDVIGTPLTPFASPPLLARSYCSS